MGGFILAAEVWVARVTDHEQLCPIGPTEDKGRDDVRWAVASCVAVMLCWALSGTGWPDAGSADP